MAEKDIPKGADPVAPTVTFDYIKSSSFRSLRADGAVGGITPNGSIHIAFYNERHAIPRRMVMELKEDGNLGEVVDMESRASIVREMDVDIFLTIEAAKNFSEWLQEIIEGHDEISGKNE